MTSRILKICTLTDNFVFFQKCYFWTCLILVFYLFIYIYWFFAESSPYISLWRLFRQSCSNTSHKFTVPHTHTHTHTLHSTVLSCKRYFVQLTIVGVFISCVLVISLIDIFVRKDRDVITDLGSEDGRLDSFW